MNRTDALVMFHHLIEADPGTVTEDDVLKDVPGWDSLAVLGFLAKADELLGVRLSPARVFGCATVGDLIDLLGVKRAA